MINQKSFILFFRDNPTGSLINTVYLYTKLAIVLFKRLPLIGELSRQHIQYRASHHLCIPGRHPHVRIKIPFMRTMIVLMPMSMVMITSSLFQIHPDRLLHEQHIFLRFQKRIQITQLERQISHRKINGTIVQSLQLLRTQITHRRIRPRWDHHVHLHVIPRNSLHEITLWQNTHANRSLLVFILPTSR